ncbi:hypothetical protein T484DRAFT_1895034 [Baffinella frigidus]|nr:hypothetical protein T484DRAFT_1895034 [Cryptophyta sp. CCMP2293]
MGQGPDVGGSEARPAPRLTGRKAMKQLQEAIKRSDLATTMEMLAITGVGARNKNGFSALHFSVVYDELAIAEHLVEIGCDIEEITLKLNTPLHISAFEGNLEMVRLFVSRGASATALNSQRRSPIDMCQQPRTLQVLTRALLERGGGEVEDAPAALCQQYHATLALRFDADDAKVEEAFSLQLQNCHPSLQPPGEEMRIHFEELCEAYLCLKTAGNLTALGTLLRLHGCLGAPPPTSPHAASSSGGSGGKPTPLDQNPMPLSLSLVPWRRIARFVDAQEAKAALRASRLAPGPAARPASPAAGAGAERDEEAGVARGVREAALREGEGAAESEDAAQSGEVAASVVSGCGVEEARGGEDEVGGAGEGEGEVAGLRLQLEQVTRALANATLEVEAVSRARVCDQARFRREVERLSGPPQNLSSSSSKAENTAPPPAAAPGGVEGGECGTCGVHAPRLTAQLLSHEARAAQLSEQLDASKERVSALSAEVAGGHALAGRLRQDAHRAHAAAASAKIAGEKGEEQHAAQLAGLRGRVQDLEGEVARGKGWAPSVVISREK